MLVKTAFFFRKSLRTEYVVFGNLKTEWSTIFNDGLGVSRSVGFLFTDQASISSCGNLGKCEMSFGTLDGQAANYPKDENLKNRVAILWKLKNFSNRSRNS